MRTINKTIFGFIANAEIHATKNLATKARKLKVEIMDKTGNIIRQVCLHKYFLAVYLNSKYPNKKCSKATVIATLKHWDCSEITFL